MMIMFPLTFLSNAFVPAETLPSWLQAFVKVNPVSHVVSALRDLMNDGAVTAEVGWALLGCARRGRGLPAAVGAVLLPQDVARSRSRSARELRDEALCLVAELAARRAPCVARLGADPSHLAGQRLPRPSPRRQRPAQAGQLPVVAEQVGDRPAGGRRARARRRVRSAARAPTRRARRSPTRRPGSRGSPASPPSDLRDLRTQVVAQVGDVAARPCRTWADSAAAASGRSPRARSPMRHADARDRPRWQHRGRPRGSRAARPRAARGQVQLGAAAEQDDRAARRRRAVVLGPISSKIRPASSNRPSSMAATPAPP